MGNAVAFQKPEPNFEALSAVINKYEALKAQGGNVSVRDLYRELDEELRTFVTSNPNQQPELPGTGGRNNDYQQTIRFKNQNNANDTIRLKESAERQKQLLENLAHGGSGGTGRGGGSRRGVTLSSLENGPTAQQNGVGGTVRLSPMKRPVQPTQPAVEVPKSGRANKNQQKSRTRSNSHNSGQQERKFCILVVDDSHISCKIAVRQLGKLGYEVDTAFSGEEALEKVGATPHRYDLMLLDIVMPGLDGIEVLSKVKGTAHLQHLPICMLSGLEDQTLAEVCLQQGALEVLLKPLKVDAVQRVVDLHCERRPQPAAGPAETLAVGDAAPDFALPDEAFAAHSLAQYLQGPGAKVMLVFFPLAFADKRYGGQLLTDVNKRFFALRSTRTQVLGVGAELPFSLQALREELGLKFPLLSDPSLKVCERYAGAFEFGQWHMNLRGTHTAGLDNCRVPAPAVVVVGPGQKVAYKWEARNESSGEPEPAQKVPLAQLLEFLDADTREAQKREPGGAGGPEGAGAGGEGRPAGERETIRNSDKLSVLIVDDSNISSKLALRKLVSLGYDTMHAENGKVALQLLRRFPGDFDLVLLDIVMPVMDGVELLTTMKADALLRAVPVAMLSGLEDEALAKVCLESGAEAVLRKPVNTDEVQEILQSKIGRK